jgi:hypothetical protein
MCFMIAVFGSATALSAVLEPKTAIMHGYQAPAAIAPRHAAAKPHQRSLKVTEDGKT